MATLREQPKWHAATAPGNHILNSSSQGLSTSPQQEYANCTFLYWSIRRYRFPRECVHLSRNICFSFRIDYTSRNWIFCCYFFWCWPARLVCRPLEPGNMWYTIEDDNVEVAAIYRCDGKATKPTRPCENHGVVIEHLPTLMQSHGKLQLKSFAVPIQGSLVKIPKFQGTQECT